MPMYCTEYGAENEEGAEFCTNCGAPLTDGIDAMTAGATAAMPAAAPAGLTAPAEAPAAASPRVGEKPATRRAVAIALLAAVVIAAGGGAGYYFGVYRADQERIAQEQADYEAKHSEHAVTLGVMGGGWDTSEGASKLPVSVTGTDVDGNRVNMTAFVESDGKGLKLVQGPYELGLAGSPLGHDGTVWATPCTTFGLKLDSSLEKDQEVDASSGEAIKLGNKIDPIDVTDEQLDTAEKLAMQGGCDSETTAKALASAARSSRDAAVSAKQAKDAAEAQKRAEQEAKKAKDEAAHAQRNAASSGAPNGAAPFWGAFAMASKNPETSWNKVEELQKSGFPDATVVCTTDWGNLNKETWYSVTAGLYASEDVAVHVVDQLKDRGISDAYARYSGAHK